MDICSSKFSRPTGVALISLTWALTSTKTFCHLQVSLSCNLSLQPLFITSFVPSQFRTYFGKATQLQLNFTSNQIVYPEKQGHSYQMEWNK